MQVGYKPRRAFAMPALPANFFGRQELQRLIIRADELLRGTEDAELTAGLHLLMSGAACLDGVMAEMEATPHPVNKALDNPNGWKAEWTPMGSCYLHTSRGHFNFHLDRQVLTRPNVPQALVPTGRLRVTLGNERHVGIDRLALRAKVLIYLQEFGDAIPESTREGCLSRFFPEPEDK